VRVLRLLEVIAALINPAGAKAEPLLAVRSVPSAQAGHKFLRGRKRSKRRRAKT
jgi:hypothetical protein